MIISVRNNYFYDTSATAEGMPYLRSRADGRAQQNPLLSDMASSTTRQASVVNSALCQMILSLRNGVGFRGS